MSKAIFSSTPLRLCERDPHANADTRPPTRARRHAPAFSAVSFLRSFLLIAFLWLAVCDTSVHAGSYQLAITGGRFVGNDGLTHDDYDDGQGNYSAFDPTAPSASVYSASGAVTVTGTWVPDPGQTLATDPPPQCVLVSEEGYAYYEANGHDFDGGTCDDGLGDAAVPWDADIACLTSGSPQLNIVHCHFHQGGPSFTWTRTPSITPGTDGGVCGDLLYSISVQGFNLPPLVLSLDCPPYYLIPPSSPDALLLGAQGLVTNGPSDPSDPFGLDGMTDSTGMLGMTSGLPGFTPGTVQNGLAGGMTQGLNNTLATAGIGLLTAGVLGVVSPVILDDGVVAESASSPIVYGPTAGGALQRWAISIGGQTLSDLTGQFGPYITTGPDRMWGASQALLNDCVSSGRPVYFDLTNMQDMEGVLNGTGQWANAVTSQELRYIQQNWPTFQNIVTFFRNGTPEGPPWLK